MAISAVPWGDVVHHPVGDLDLTFRDLFQAGQQAQRVVLPQPTDPPGQEFLVFNEQFKS